jgi:Protein of unknown function (DUF2384)
MPVANPARSVSARRGERHPATQFFAQLGVPDTVLERGRVRDWHSLEAELDRFSAYGHGTATQRRFLHTPHPQLMGATPAEVLAERDGIERVRRALRRTLDAAERI